MMTCSIVYLTSLMTHFQTHLTILLRFHGSIPFPLNISDPTMDLLLELQHAGMFSYKYLHQNLQKFDKSYKDLVWHIFCWQYVGGEVLLLIQKCKLWPTAWNAIRHIYHIWGIVTKYCQYEILNFALSCTYNIFLSNCFLFQTLQNTYKKHYEWWGIRL